MQLLICTKRINLIKFVLGLAIFKYKLIINRQRMVFVVGMFIKLWEYLFIKINLYLTFLFI